MTRKLPPLNYLRAFESSAKTLSFTKGAIELHVTQSAISKQVLHLESIVGVPLFTRHIRRLELTREGELLLAKVSEALDLLEDGFKEIHRLHGKQIIQISMPPTFALRIGATEIIRFQQSRPGVEIRIRIDNDGVALDGTDIDLAIEFMHQDECMKTHQFLFSERLTPVCTAAYLTTFAGCSPDEILEQGILLHTQQRDAAYGDWQAWLQEAGHARTDCARGLVFQTADMALDAALQGAGIAISDINFVSSYLDQKTLVAPFDHWYESGRSYYIRLRQKPLPPSLAQDLANWFMADVVRRVKHAHGR
jgi:LysR family transcriptional regulator, glycine cleavage system transcriptional activator